jgi:hypothetical protein
MFALILTIAAAIAPAHAAPSASVDTASVYEEADTARSMRRAIRQARLDAAVSTADVAEVEMAPVLVTGAPLGGDIFRSLPGSVELEGRLYADGVTSAETEVFYAHNRGSAVAEGRAGSLERGDTAVLAWMNMGTGEVEMASRQLVKDNGACVVDASQSITMSGAELQVYNEDSLQDNPTRQGMDHHQPSFAMGTTADGHDVVYAALTPGDQITMVEVVGPELDQPYSERVSLKRGTQSLELQRGQGGAQLCYGK